MVVCFKYTTMKSNVFNNWKIQFSPKIHFMDLAFIFEAVNKGQNNSVPIYIQYVLIHDK